MYVTQHGTWVMRITHNTPKRLLPSAEQWRQYRIAHPQPERLFCNLNTGRVYGERELTVDQLMDPMFQELLNAQRYTKEEMQMSIDGDRLMAWHQDH